MGSCISRKSTPPPPPLVTTKLILSNGGLLQFSRPIMASHVLGRDESTCFVCDSDTMEIDRDLTALAGDKELRLGQIYFVLPRSMLNKPLKGNGMAELAVRASVALSETGTLGRRGRRRMVAPLDFAEREKGKEMKKENSKAFKFLSDLRTIPE